LEGRRLLSAGALDLTFGTNGTVTTDFGGDDSGNAVAVQADGKIVVGGQATPTGATSRDFALARYNADGSLDTAFGPNHTGQVTTDFGGADELHALALQHTSAGDKIVAAGSTFANGDFNFAVARYNADGSLDTTFGSGGKVTTDLGSTQDEAKGVTIEAGKVLVVGQTLGTTTGFNFALVRYNDNGSLDTTFGPNHTGKVSTDFAGKNDIAAAVALQADGKIVVAGSSVKTTNDDFALARYNVDGSLDTAFGIGGKVTTDFAGAFDNAFALALQADGKIVAAGSAQPAGGGSDAFGLARYNPNGSLDGTFGPGGKVTTPIGAGSDIFGVAVQADGRVVAAGSAQTTTGVLALARYRADGSPDNSFGTGGQVTTAFGSAAGGAQAVALQADGKVVAAGFTNQNSDDFAVARYQAFSDEQEAFVLGLDNQVYEQTFDAAGHSSSNYTLTKPGAVKALAAGHDAANHPLLFVIGLDNQVYAQKFDASGTSVSNYTLTKPGAVLAIAAGSTAANNPELFVIGLDNQVYEQLFDAAGNSTGNYVLTRPGAVKGLAVAADGRNDPLLFVLGLDNQVYAQKFDAAGHSASNYVLTKPGAVKALSVGQDAFDDPALFVIGLDSQVYSQKFDLNGNSAGGYVLTKPGQVEALALGHDAADRPELFVIGLDGQVYAQKFDAGGSSAGSYVLTAPGRVQAIVLGSDGGDRPELFAVGLDGQVEAQPFDGPGTSAGPFALTKPGAVKALALPR
jgi:uncharacterized delta-60 repeat protein